ncbi:MAG TPA: plasmid stabilization protein [Candidatus Magasanikbacteria bacterium]|nr:plasmid stabilization protein [Candidatus Magasanikbacteria bacterium]
MRGARYFGRRCGSRSSTRRTQNGANKRNDRVTLILLHLQASNPLHPSLRIHALQGNLKGLWSISITGSYRIIFERQKNGDILFISIGKHDIYKNL